MKYYILHWRIMDCLKKGLVDVIVYIPLIKGVEI